MRAFRWLSVEEIVALHDEFLAIYGGAAGVRDRGLLEAAAARPRTWASFAPEPGIIDIAARYTGAIVRNHPFIDGNKRTAFMAGLTFADIHGVEIRAEQELATEAVLKLAAGVIDEDAYAAFLRAGAHV